MLDTVEDLIQQVRDVTDEDNAEDVSDAFIIRMLNRAQQDLVSEITRKYNPQFMNEVVLTSSNFAADSSGVARVADLSKYMSSVAFKVNSVDSRIGDAWIPVRQVPFSHTLSLDTKTGTSSPILYSMQGSRIYVYPNIDTLVQLRIRYQMRPPKLVATEGRIVEWTANTVTLNKAPSSISNSGDDLLNYINIIDQFTGQIKATLQVNQILDKEITIKTTDVRDTIFGLPVSAAIPEDVSSEDLVCHAAGTCIPFLVSDLTNYHVEIAAFHVKRALGTVDTPDFQERDRVIERVSKLWSGRENTMKINRTRSFPLYSWQSFFRGS
jgi:hypothetical protein